MEGFHRKLFEFCWPDFREKFWFMVSFLEDVEKGCSCAFDYLLNEWEEIKQGKPSIYTRMNWLMHLFKFDEDKFTPLKDVVFDFF